MQNAVGLLRPQIVVHPDNRIQGTDDRGEPKDQLDPERGGGVPLRQYAGEQRRLVVVARALLGYTVEHLGVRRV